MKLPDIANLPRDRAWSLLQHTLKQEQNELPEGHGIWFNYLYVAEVKRNYICLPVRYKIASIFGFVDQGLKLNQQNRIAISAQFRKRGIISVRVTGPIINCPLYKQALINEQKRYELNQQRLDEEWLANQPEYIRAKIQNARKPSLKTSYRKDDDEFDF